MRRLSLYRCTHAIEPDITGIQLYMYNTGETGYKNIVGSRKTCSYNRCVLITGVLITDVLITGMFL